MKYMGSQSSNVAVTGENDKTHVAPFTNMDKL